MASLAINKPIYVTVLMVLVLFEPRLLQANPTKTEWYSKASLSKCSLALSVLQAPITQGKINLLKQTQEQGPEELTPEQIQKYIWNLSRVKSEGEISGEWPTPDMNEELSRNKRLANNLRVLSYQYYRYYKKLNSLYVKVFHREDPVPKTLVLLGEMHIMTDWPLNLGTQIISGYPIVFVELPSQTLERALAQINKDLVSKNAYIEKFANSLLSVPEIEALQQSDVKLHKSLMLHLMLSLNSRDMNAPLVIGIDEGRLPQTVHKKETNSGPRIDFQFRNHVMVNKIDKVLTSESSKNEAVVVVGRSHVDPMTELLVKMGWQEVQF